jgi:hypothetical protein
MTDPRTHVADAKRIAALWGGLLLPPAAFLLNLEAAYALVPAACRSGSLPIHLVNAVSLLLALLGGLIAYRCRETEGTAWPRDESGAVARTRFMARLGVLTSATFVLVILAQWVPGFVLSPCQ